MEKNNKDSLGIEYVKMDHVTMTPQGDKIGLTKPFIQKGRSFINIKDDDIFNNIDRFIWSDEHFGTFKYNEFQLSLDSDDGFRFVEEDENGDTFLLEVGDTDCHLYFHWDEIQKDIKNMGLHLLPMSQLEVVEDVDFLLPEREFVWGDGYVLTVHPVLRTNKREVLSDGGK